MSYVLPTDFTQTMVQAGAKKMNASLKDTLVRAYMGGAILAMAAAMAVTITVQTGNALLGAVLFPIGFIMIYLLGFDLLTGVFTLNPLAVIAKEPGATWGALLRNWGLVFLGNFAGAFTVAVLMAIVVTFGFTTTPNEVGVQIGEIGHSRTVGYAEAGAGGMLTLFVRGVLCNWMVSTGVVMFMVSKDTIGKIVGMWMPVFLFFYMAFEHSVVNMFLFPSGLLLGGGFTVMDYLVWNELPTVLGNLVGGLTFVGLPLYLTHRKRVAARAAEAPSTPGTTHPTAEARTAGEAPLRAPATSIPAPAGTATSMPGSEGTSGAGPDPALDEVDGHAAREAAARATEEAAGAVSVGTAGDEGVRA